MVLSLLPERDALTETVDPVEFRPGAGALVAGTVGAPIATAPARQSEPTPSRGRVLVVDEERRIRLAIRVCLEAEGYEVEEAADLCPTGAISVEG